jgi:transposase
LINIQANTAIKFYQHLRQLIASKLSSYELSGEVEADESYFGGVRKGKRGRGAAGKIAVFGLLKRCSLRIIMKTHHNKGLKMLLPRQYISANS